MHPRAAVAATLAGLLTGGLMIASGATPAAARPAPLERAGTTLTARLAPPVVTVGEPSAVVVRATPVRSGRTFTVQRLVGNTWQPYAATSGDAAGRAVVPVDTSVAGTQVLRVISEATANLAERISPQLALKVYTPASCTPKITLVDPAATAGARCLAARLDRWKAAGLMGVGQQLNMSTRLYRAPLDSLGARRVSVVGFDLWELAKTKNYQFPFFDEALADLTALAQGGAVLSASWHPPNPHTGQEYDDRTWHDLAALLQDSTPEAQVFWSDFDAQLEVFRSLQDAGVAVVFRPFHEVNGDWFWWGRPAPATFRALWREMQDRAWAAEVHNVVWAYSFAARTRRGIAAPERLLPSRVDLAGIDTYYPAAGSHRRQAPSMSGYAAVAKRVKRMTITEVGPSRSPDGSWNPSVITPIARGVDSRPVWATLWVDDPQGRKQISSLQGGLSWLDSCGNGYCYLR